MKRLIGVVATLAIVFGVLAGYHAVRDHRGKPDVNVTLTQAGDVCTPAVSDVIGGGWLKKVTWHITNGCTNAQVVTMQDFVKDDGGKKSTDRVSVFSDDPVVSETINPGAGEYQLKARISKFVLLTSLYHYTICTRAPSGANRCVDPDVEIWP